MSTWFELGSIENSWYGGGSFPQLMLFDTLLANHGLFQKIINVHTNSFGYNTSYTISGDTSIVLTAKFESIPGTDNKEFLLNLIEGLDHSFPNGTNHPIVGINQHWNWLRQFSLLLNEIKSQMNTSVSKVQNLNSLHSSAIAINQIVSLPL